MRRQRFERFGQRDSPSRRCGETSASPPRVGGILLGNRDAVAEEERTEALRPLGRRIGFRHRFQPGQGQRQSGAAKERASIKMPGGTGHGCDTFRILMISAI